MQNIGRYLCAVALLSVLSTGCGDDVEPESEGSGERNYSMTLELRGSIGLGQKSRYWTFNVNFYRYPQFPDRTCVVYAYAAEMISPSDGILTKCSSGCLTGHFCGFGCDLDLQTCEDRSGGNPPRVKVFYKNVHCPRRMDLGPGFLAYPVNLEACADQSGG